MSFEGLQERLAALQETTSQLRELIDRLTNLEFRPGSVPLDTNEEGSVSGELSSEISNLLRDGDDERELLQEEVEYLRSDEKTRLREGVERQGQELERCRAQFRRARLAAKKNLAQAQRLERELTVQFYSIPAEPETEAHEDADTSVHEKISQFQRPQKPQRQHFQDQLGSLSEKDRQTVGASSRVTDSLRQMHASLQEELERSEYANQTMRESTAAFQQLHESYSSLEVMLSSSRDLLSTLLRSQKSDTWYLTTALYMLLVVGAWLVFRRLLYGPLWWLIWLPLRVVFGVGSKAGSAVMHAGSGKVDGSEGVSGTETKVAVDGLPGDDLPTVQVGKEDVSVEDVVEEVVGKEAGMDGSREGQGVEEETRPRDEL